MPSTSENQPGVEKPSSLRATAAKVLITDKAAITAQAMPTRTSTSSANTIRALKPCSVRPTKFILEWPA
ncbi:hypothetical protein D9M68_1003970 [compost metagenome]